MRLNPAPMHGHWDATSWVTVPGGTLTGNNKVWKKRSFSAITTSKLRVLTSASPDNYSRITELEAWGPTSGGSSSADIRWVVADQLGTPRLSAERTGSLAGVSRHDYLPFGEEIGVGVGGRSTSQGYVGDSVRQKFAGTERDGETGLDFMQARYYASALPNNSLLPNNSEGCPTIPCFA